MFCIPIITITEDIKLRIACRFGIFWLGKSGIMCNFTIELLLHLKSI